MLRRPHHVPPPGFTLVEMLISMAIVVILIVGVNAVFRMASDTVGTGEALSAAQRNNRNIQSVIYNDVRNAVTYNYPFFIIQSETTAAFRNAADEQSDKDYSRDDALNKTLKAIRSIDIDGNGKETDPGEMTAATALSRRNHRLDQVAFFARGNFTRQTGNEGTYASNLTSNEALIWYGHLRQPRDFNPDKPLTDEQNKPRKPGPEATDASKPPETASTSPTNFYAANWILGRAVMLLREPMLIDGDYVIREQLNDKNTEQFYIGRKTPPSGYSLAPLEGGQDNQQATSLSLRRGGFASDSKSKTAYPVDWFRYDVAGTSIDQYRDFLGRWMANKRSSLPPRSDVFIRPGVVWPEAFTYRFVGYPYVTRPLTSEMASRSVAAFLPGCTQFAVEFAGDFVTQENRPADANYGDVLDIKPDGVTDFFVVKPSNDPITWRREIRWYGFPRDVNGDGIIQGIAKKNNDLQDVVPLRDVFRTSTGGIPNDYVAPVEFKQMDRWLPPSTNYATATLPQNSRYICAWSQDSGTFPLPQMLRFTVAIDDSTGRLPEGQTYEYVMELPH